MLTEIERNGRRYSICSLRGAPRSVVPGAFLVDFRRVAGGTFGALGVERMSH